VLVWVKNESKCVFDVSAGKFLGFNIPEHGIEIDPTKKVHQKSAAATI
jgi:hypothetical protein